MHFLKKVAKIQLTIQNELRQIQSPKTQEAVRFLDTELYNLSDVN